MVKYVGEGGGESGREGGLHVKGWFLNSGWGWGGGEREQGGKGALHGEGSLCFLATLEENGFVKESTEMPTVAYPRLSGQSSSCGE